MRAADGFEEFVTIVDAGSLTAAAEVLDLPRATLSRRLAKLEQRLGVRLLHRTTRRMTLTPAGQLLHQRARVLVEGARDVEAEVRRLDGVPRGLLRVSVPSTLAHEFFARWLTAFLQAYPEVSLEFVATSLHVDLAAEGFDLALRRGPIDDPSLITRSMSVDTSIAVASPAYLERAGTPTTPAELDAHNCIVGYRAGRQPERRWPLLAGGSVTVSGSLATNDIELRRAVALSGLGIALISAYSAHANLDQGELIHVLPEHVGARERVNLVYVEREFLDPKIRAFVDFFVTELGRERERASTD